MDVNSEVLKGYIDLILLSLLLNESLYGYELSRRIRISSNETFELKEGTLYLALKRLEKNDLVEGYWDDTQSGGGGRRRYYKITERGINRLNIKKSEWLFFRNLIDGFLGEV